MDSIKIKLAVDRSRNRVLFADAGSDFVDVLLSFLTLPLSAIQFCAASSPGCLSNLCDSVSRLTGGKLLKVEACHGMLLTPSTDHEFGGGRSDFCDSYGTFVKNQPNLQVDGDFCRCWLVMARLVYVYNRVSSGSGTFVRCKEQFMISDDWTIMPASTGAMQSLARNFGPGAILHDFEELEVCVGWTEVVSMLKASLSSDTIFTDVFLPMGTADQDALATVKPSIHKKIVVTPNEDSGPRAPLECKIKLFYDGQEKKVMYAECKHEFVDLLLGFLAYPLGCVIKNMYDNAVTSPLGNGGFDNLYSSVGELDAAGFIIGDKTTETLLNPPLSPFSVCAKFAIRKDPFAVARQKKKDPFAVEPLNYMGLVGLVEHRNYLVDDDLLMHQASGMSVSKHWCRRDKANVVEMEITIGKPEAVELLRAMLTSKTPLTDVFNDRLEEHSSLQKMQISVELPTGKIITVEVSRFDYIATVKSRIMLEVPEVPIPAGRRHVLIWGAETLEDSCTVGDYNLVPGCTITCGFQVDNDDVYELLV